MTDDLAILRHGLLLVRHALEGVRRRRSGNYLALDEQAWELLEHLALREIDTVQANAEDKGRPF